MQPHSSPLFKLTTAIDHRPLTVEAQTLVGEAIDTMAAAQKSCVLTGLELSLNTVLKTQARGTSVWVVDQGQLLGQFTQAEALAAIASRIDRSQAIATAMAAPKALQAPAASDFDALLAALETLRQQQTTHLPVFDDQGHFSGVIHLEGIRSVLQLDDLLKQVSLGAVMQPNPLTVAGDNRVLDLAEQMVAQQQLYAVVLSSDRHPAGLITASDVLQLQRLGLDLTQVEAQTIMQAPPLSLPSDLCALEGYWRMQQQQTQHILVIGPQGDLVGLATPVSYLSALPLEQMRQSMAALQRSIAQFQAPDSDSPPRLTPPNQLECSGLLSTMALHIRESLDADTILQTAVGEVRQFLDCDRVLIYRFNPDLSGTVVVESVAEGWRPALNSTVQDTCFGQNYAQAYKQGRTQVVDDIYLAGLSQCHIDILVLFDVRASLVVPILQGDHLWGLLCAYHCAAPRHWQAFEVDLLKQLATHMAIAIQQSDLYTQLQSELRERQRFELELKASLKEKESLLKEIHHRVKNNLQIISSVLRLQADYIQNEEVLGLFRDSQHRIQSMALIHEKLYKSRDLTRICMEEYIQDLTSSLLSSHFPMSVPVELAVQADEVWLNIDTAIPCGLIINELMSNALKHAFPEGQQPPYQVQVAIGRRADDRIVLTVQDNGVGFPPELDFQNTDSLGLELVCVFTEQLRGTIELYTYRGTGFVITFAEFPEHTKGGA